MGFKWMIYIAVALLWSGCKGKKDNTYQDIVRPVRVVNVHFSIYLEYEIL